MTASTVAIDALPYIDKEYEGTYSFPLILTYNLLPCLSMSLFVFLLFVFIDYCPCLWPLMKWLELKDQVNALIQQEMSSMPRRDNTDTPITLFEVPCSSLNLVYCFVASIFSFLHVPFDYWFLSTILPLSLRIIFMKHKYSFFSLIVAVHQVFAYYITLLESSVFTGRIRTRWGWSKVASYWYATLPASFCRIRCWYWYAGWCWWCREEATGTSTAAVY